MHITGLTLFAILFITTVFGQSMENTSKWHSKEFQQDDQIPSYKYLYDKKNDVFYLFTNDKKNLYVHLKSSNNNVPKLILMEGVKVNFKTKVKGKKKVQIDYPLNMEERMALSNVQFAAQPGRQNEEQSDSRYRGNMGGPPMEKDFSDAEKEKLMNSIRDIKLTYGNSEELMAVVNPDHISGDIHFNRQGELFYKLSIPFEQLGMDYHAKKMYISVTSGRSSASSSSQSGMGRGPGGISGAIGGGPGGGMGGGPRGGMGGGPGGSAGDGSSSMQGPPSQKSSSTISIKVKKLKLAKN
ncbi:hypothetical protein [Saccharicrinis sp. 156]|uniref:hypothetical protein n=1 Tax=Saccharicrinis sp. 156 TaxID=3417574 RepID=UPI003D35733D